MDKRQVRTQERLYSAILDLATKRPASELTMSEIAARANVHRSTLYEHASSPADLLQAALRSELDDIRDRYLVSPTDAAAAVAATTEAVLQHVDAHATIYLRGLGSGSESASLHAMLASHFQASTQMLIELRVVKIPSAVEGVDASVVAETAANYIANGTVGAIEVWLRTPEPRHPSSFVAVFDMMVPKWWPKVGNSRVS
jgi:AcrR family transcriptional regulator